MKRCYDQFSIGLTAEAYYVSAGIDAAFEKFWGAKSPGDAEHRIDDIIKPGVTFDEAMRRLKAGRAYTSQTAATASRKSRLFTTPIRSHR